MGELIIPNAVMMNRKSELPDEIRSIGRYKICCFTGHRRKQLPGNGSEADPGFQALRALTEKHIRELIRRGISYFMTGMSSGYDVMAADIVANTPDIADKAKLLCAVPYKKQFYEMKTAGERELYQQIISVSEKNFVISEDYYSGCYQVRNQFMVNCSTAVIGYVLDPDMQRSGTAQTFRMAANANIEVRMILPYNIENALKG